MTRHNGSNVRRTKIAAVYSPSDKITARSLLHETARRGEYATGIIYVEPDKQDFVELLGVVDEPLAFLPDAKTRPGKAALDEIMESFR